MVSEMYLTLEGGDYLLYSQSRGIARCFEAYSLNTEEERIRDVGYDAKTNTFYILLKNGIEIQSVDGNTVSYVCYDNEHNKFRYFDEYERALGFIGISV